jgi:tetratricopeptide (TPR) repeat protein
MAIEAYSRAIDLDPKGPLYSGRAGAHALLRNIELATSDYSEALRQGPARTFDALSRMEVQIWAGKPAEARASYEAIQAGTLLPEEKTIALWLMCHALNLEGGDIMALLRELEEAAEGCVIVNYSVSDIEPYLRETESAGRLSEKQISQAWLIQGLVMKRVPRSAEAPVGLSEPGPPST